MSKNECRSGWLDWFLLLLFTMMVCPAGSIGETNVPGYLPPPEPQNAGAAEEVIPDRYIVKFKEPPLTVYKGGIPGLAPTNPAARGIKKLDISDSNSINYLNYINKKHSDFRTSIKKTLGREARIERAFRIAFNGMTVAMSRTEAHRISKLPEVAAVMPDKKRYLHTDSGPAWIGADQIWNGSVSTATKGEGIVIGVIDTGINPSNPSFADIGGDGYNHTNPRPKMYGFGDPGHPDYDPSFPCNDKLIGAYDFARDSGEPALLYDDDGHGSHTASTAAGNVVAPAAIIAPTITINPNISGVAPHANIISYRGLRDGSGATSWLVAAIDQATADGVDVINYSIGGSASDPWTDADSEALLNAREAGVFVATSAGNSGPGGATLGSPGNAPWLLTVGSSSHNRRFSNSLTNLTSSAGSLPDIKGMSLTGSLSASSIVYAGYYGDPLCQTPFPAGTFTGKIVVCDRGVNGRVEKGENVLAGGAAGMVLANDEANGDSLSSDAHVLPAVHIGYDDGVTLKTWLASGTSHNAAIAGTTLNLNDLYGDIMSAFSSRGPNGPVPGVIKPDVSAPGQDILAANGVNNEATWGVMSGTSMASPHAAGAAALITALHPDWTPAQIQSALMTTSHKNVLKEDAATAASPFDTGAGRVSVNEAARAGFVLDVTPDQYRAADPAAGGDPKTLNIPSLGRENIVQRHTWYRTVKSTSSSNITWNTSVTNPSGVALTVNPASFTLAAGGAKTIAITADANAASLDDWLFGCVNFIPAEGSVSAANFPMALKRVASTLPPAIRYTNVGSVAKRTLKGIETLEISSLTVQCHGITPAIVDSVLLYQDPTPDDPYDGKWDSDDASNKDGLYVKYVPVPAGAKRLVVEIINSNSPDVDMYVYRWTGSAWVWICSSAAGGSSEYCSVAAPVPGDYYVFIHNYQARDNTATTPDNVSLATAAVPSTSSGNLTVALAGGGTTASGDVPVNFDLAWNLSGPALHWYGQFGVGTDAGNPNNLGTVDLDLHLSNSLAPIYLLLLE